MMLQATWDILCESAFFILVGFAIAGGLRVLVPTRWVMNLLQPNRSSSVLLASLIGLPLPLCSCSVLPAAVALRQKGASKGAMLSFLISTPETSATSVLLTYGLLGPTMAIFRPIAASITAITAGLVQNALDRRAPSGGTDASPNPAGECGCCGAEAAAPSEDAAPLAWTQKVREALRYGFRDLFDSIFGWLLLGVVAAAFIQVLLPETVIHAVFRGSFQSMLLMIVLGVPLYVCAEASTPIAAALILQGVSPGAALVLLLVGPATNVGSLGVLRGLLGRRTIVIYLTCIVLVAVVMGVLLDNFVGQSDIVPTIKPLSDPLVPRSLKVAGAVLFLILSGRSMRRLRVVSRLVERLDRVLPWRVTGKRVLVLAAVLGGIAYVASGLFTVQPGERGVVKRFGAIARAGLGPGLHYAWPWPIESVDRVRVTRVHRLVLGFKVDPVTGRRTGETHEDESWTLAGDENITDIKTAVHWSAVDTEDAVLRYQYSVADREALVRSVVQAAMRDVIGTESISRIFTARRQAVEREVAARAQALLAQYDSGIHLRGLVFLDAHAPAPVHEAFRDVAGAMEDKAARINNALAEEARMIPAARGMARKGAEEAVAYADRTVASARGEAARFQDILDAYHHWPGVTTVRLYLEALDAVLPGVPKYVKPPNVDAGDLEIWFVEPEAARALPPLDRGVGR